MLFDAFVLIVQFPGSLNVESHVQLYHPASEPVSLFIGEQSNHEEDGLSSSMPFDATSISPSSAQSVVTLNRIKTGVPVP